MASCGGASSGNGGGGCAVCGDCTIKDHNHFNQKVCRFAVCNNNHVVNYFDGCFTGALGGAEMWPRNPRGWQSCDDAKVGHKKSWVKELPVFKDPAIRRSIMDAVDRNRNGVVLVPGKTGCGKTQGMPLFLVEEAMEAAAQSCSSQINCKFFLVIPNKKTAISTYASQRMLMKDGHKHVCFRKGSGQGVDGCHPNKAILNVCTYGYLTTFLRYKHNTNKYLGAAIGHTHLILDEIHQRDLDCDLMLLYVKQLLKRSKNGLQVILMSATVDPKLYSDYFSSDNISFEALEPIGNEPQPITYVYTDTLRGQFYSNDRVDTYAGKARNYLSEVEVELLDEGDHLSDSTNKKNDNFFSIKNSEPRQLAAKLIMAHVVYGIHEEIKDKADKNGTSALIFESGRQECEDMRRTMGDELIRKGFDYDPARRTEFKTFYRFPNNEPYEVQIISVSGQDSADKDKKIDSPGRGNIYIYIATNVIESSITIGSLDTVISMGCKKLPVFDNIMRKDLSSLKKQWIPKASAIQQAGRTGRKAPQSELFGCTVFRMFSKENMKESNNLPENPQLIDGSSKRYTVINLPAFDKPAIQRLNLDNTIMEYKRQLYKEELNDSILVLTVNVPAGDDQGETTRPKTLNELFDDLIEPPSVNERIQSFEFLLKNAFLSQAFLPSNHPIYRYAEEHKLPSELLKLHKLDGYLTVSGEFSAKLLSQNKGETIDDLVLSKMICYGMCLGCEDECIIMAAAILEGNSKNRFSTACIPQDIKADLEANLTPLLDSDPLMLLEYLGRCTLTKGPPGSDQYTCTYSKVDGSGTILVPDEIVDATATGGGGGVDNRRRIESKEAVKEAIEKIEALREAVYKVKTNYDTYAEIIKESKNKNKPSPPTLANRSSAGDGGDDDDDDDIDIGDAKFDDENDSKSRVAKIKEFKDGRYVIANLTPKKRLYLKLILLWCCPDFRFIVPGGGSCGGVGESTLDKVSVCSRDSLCLAFYNFNEDSLQPGKYYCSAATAFNDKLWLNKAFLCKLKAGPPASLTSVTKESSSSSSFNWWKDDKVIMTNVRSKVERKTRADLCKEFRVKMNKCMLGHYYDQPLPGDYDHSDYLRGLYHFNPASPDEVREHRLLRKNDELISLLDIIFDQSSSSSSSSAAGGGRS